MSPLQDTDVLAISRNDPTTAGTYQLPVGDLKAYIAAAPIKPDWNAPTTAANGILNRPGLATTTTSGLMSGPDKLKLDGFTGSYVNRAGDTMTGSLVTSPTAGIQLRTGRSANLVRPNEGRLRILDDSNNNIICDLGESMNGVLLSSSGQLTLGSEGGPNGGVHVVADGNYIEHVGQSTFCRNSNFLPALASDVHVLSSAAPVRHGIISIGNTNSELSAQFRYIPDAQTLAIRCDGGDMSFRIAATKSFSFMVTPGGLIAKINPDGSWSALSDRKHKKNVATLKHGLDTVMSLRPVSFDHTGGQGLPETMPAGVASMGFIAQEVEELIPEAVQPANDEHGSMLTVTHLIPVLVKAVQELTARVKTLEGAT